MLHRNWLHKKTVYISSAMVKAVVAEETRLKPVEDRLSQSSLPSEALFSLPFPSQFHLPQLSPFLFLLILTFLLSLFLSPNFQVGLVIGKFSSALDRVFVFDLIPTPNNDAGEPASSITEPDKKKGSKSDSSSLFIDKDWVAEHARQVHYSTFVNYHLLLLLLFCYVILVN